ncbi:hypothetical protein [Pseudonocardia sp. MH-G8]|uniref:hypothetical protein n=1 Tax=Pseudonocardia sp. MH-G8 TaxID=1854588 RepID=UPI000BA05008|nr:hypothetical protein [Pseudonocardia sp. MH-G8]OZM82745.1 SAM-dependent methyltransferase [Pseudonocardia sp. MH-G8]
MTDWASWHLQYEDPGSELSQRLVAVQEQIALALQRAAPGSPRLLSLCAGDGRDVLPVLAGHPRGRDVTGRLVELDPVLSGAARAAAPPSIEVLTADAGSTAACAGAVPADLLLLCGIFGNVGDADVARTVAAVPALLATGGTVIWTRHRRAPDLTVRIRSWLSEAGVEEVAFATAPGSGWSVGAGVLRARSAPMPTPGGRLFTFQAREG